MSSTQNSQRPLHRQAFPEFGTLDVAIPAHFEDVSRHHDVCPSFRQVMPDGQSLRLRIERKYPADREHPGLPRFLVGLYDFDETLIHNLILSEDYAEVQRAIAAFKPATTSVN